MSDHTPDPSVEPTSSVEPVETTSSVETTASVEPVETTASVEPVETTTPLLRVVRGDPTPEELAALVAVVSSLAAGAAAAGSQDAAPRPEWSARHRALRPPHRHGPGAWRASAR